MMIISIQRILFLVFLLAIFAGAIVLQVFLSKKESKWLGLILPIISFGISLLAMLGILFFAASTSTLTVNGEIVEQITQTGSASAIIGSAIFTFLFCNIPTGILLAIYGGCRSKRNKQRALEKMSAQDLE